MSRMRDHMTGVAVGAVIVLAAGLIPNLDRAINGPKSEPQAPAQMAALAQKLDRVNAGLDALVATQVAELASLKTVADLAPARFQPLVMKAAADHALDPRLLAALVWVETGGTWNPTLRGAAGEYGLTQIMPATAQDIADARKLSVPDLTDPAQNLDWGGWYLAALVKAAKGDAAEALRQYNAGPWWKDRAPGAARGYSRRVMELAAEGR